MFLQTRRANDMLYCITLQKPLESRLLPPFSSGSPRFNPPWFKAARLLHWLSCLAAAGPDVWREIATFKKERVSVEGHKLADTVPPLPLLLKSTQYSNLKSLAGWCPLFKTFYLSLCFQRQNPGVSEKLISKFMILLGGLRNSSMDECSTDTVLMLICQRYRYSPWSLIMEHNFHSCCLPTPKRQLCFLPFNEKVL